MTAASVLALAALFAALAAHAFSDSYPFDAAFLMTAGRMWAAGLNPYGPDFAAHGGGYIPDAMAIWAYPPQWWPIATTLAAFGDHGVAAWKVVNLVALSASAALLLDTLSERRSQRELLLAGCFVAILFTADATQLTLRLGQTSAVTALGFALLLNGLSTASLTRQGLGLALLLLKPQLGLVFLLLMIGRRASRPAVVMSFILTAAASLPLLFSAGIPGAIEAMGDWLSNMDAYRKLPFNGLGELTGIAYAAAWLGMPSPPPILCVLASWLATLAACPSRPEPEEAETMPRHCVVGLGVSLVLIPLHYYDFIMLPAFLLLIPRLTPWAGWAVIASNAVAWRGCSTGWTMFMYRKSGAFPDALVGSVLQAGTATLAGGLVLAALLLGQRRGCAAPERPRMLPFDWKISSRRV